MNFCNEDKKCKFVAFGVKDNGDKLCRKYRSCDRSRTAKNAATTYSKDGICPGSFCIKGIENCIQKLFRLITTMFSF